ncbi:MAG: GNAT family N-acetyltransferase [Pseudomonadota bacterium]
MNVQATPRVRQAAPKDARTLAKLIDIAGEGIPNWLWSRHYIDGKSPLDVGEKRAKRASGGFSYTNALIAEDEGVPVGMVLSYAIHEAPDDNPRDLPLPIAPFVALEKLSVGTWYVNALAVFANKRGSGTGSRLLQAAEDLGVANGSKAMSIQVYEQNVGAVRLYTNFGYEIAAREPVRLHPCQPYYTGDVLLLTKPLGQ